MQQNPITNFLDRVKLLPLDIREGILNVDFLTALREIQEKNKLHIDQGSGLEELTYKLILGDLEESGYVNNLEEMIHIDNQTANTIAVDVNDKILQPIREEIQRLEEESEVLGIEPAAEGSKDAVKTDETKTVAAGQDIEYHNGLTPENILHEIENPQASVGTVHQTVVTTQETPPSAPAVSTTPKEEPVKTTYPDPALQTVKPPVISIAEALGQKLTEQQVSRPTEIQHTIDPYHEPIN